MSHGSASAGAQRPSAPRGTDGSAALAALKAGVRDGAPHARPAVHTQVRAGPAAQRHRPGCTQDDGPGRRWDGHRSKRPPSAGPARPRTSARARRGARCLTRTDPMSRFGFADSDGAAATMGESGAPTPRRPRRGAFGPAAAFLAPGPRSSRAGGAAGAPRGPRPPACTMRAVTRRAPPDRAAKRGLKAGPGPDCRAQA